MARRADRATLAYNKHMSILKSIVAKLAVALLPVALFSFGAYVSAYQFLQSPKPVKTAVADSGLYQAGVTELLGTSSSQTITAGGLAIPLNNPEIQKAIAFAAPAKQLQTQTERAIDNTYNWVHGESPRLQFSVDLQDTQANLAASLATYADQRVKSLPACAGGEVPDMQNPLSATCLPPNADRAALSANIRAGLASNPNLLTDPQLTANSATDSQGRSLDSRLAKLPAVYEHVKWGALVSGLLALLLTVAVLLLHSGLANGLRRWAKSALIVGLLSAVIAWLAGLGLQKVGHSLASVDGGAVLQSAAIKAITLLTQQIRNWWLLYGLVLAGLAMVAYLASRVIGKQQRAPIAPAYQSTATRTTNSTLVDGTQPPAPQDLRDTPDASVPTQPHDTTRL
jgi:cytochrome bd-type quinol oxidase subunit 1